MTSQRGRLARRRSRPRWSPKAGRRPACRGAGQVRLALLERALVEQHPVSGQDRLARAGPSAAARRLPGARLARGAVPGAEPRPSRRVRNGVGQPEMDVRVRRPACAARGRPWRRGAGQLLRLERGLEQAGPALPVEEGAGLLGDGRDREHHVRVRGDLGGPQLQTDHEPARFERLAGARRVRQVAGSTPRDEQGAQLAGGRGLEDLAGVAARSGAGVRVRPRPRRPVRGRAGR